MPNVLDMEPSTQSPAVRLVPMEEIVIFPISADELEAIDDGGADSLVLTFGISLLSVGLGYLCSFLLIDTSKFQSDIRSTIFLIVMIIGLILGPILLTIWWKLPNRRQKIIARIRQRATAPAEGTQLIPGGQFPQQREEKTP